MLFVKRVSGGSTGYAGGRVLKYSLPSLAQQDLAAQRFPCDLQLPDCRTRGCFRKLDLNFGLIRSGSGPSAQIWAARAGGVIVFHV